ncbi:iron ABC transporter permease [Prevotella scopos JCM 17725]|uniref:Iron complex transport system permease protein n=1 Tax=Prevotella scopos JCM 17725 TaxID=1236518 RepID=A0AAX2F0M1_9BACT|nr:iron ABC transporter permease [Prevotella scopos]ANR74316.1 iron ABC transporter [Prevotella scopos JCM 17725]QUB44933.1 iron ABC transporter permease [Prevotella scopos JCM 17725]SHF54528.1 iron complex transport system permease protein [Prevotella scopos JCM 17725]
MKRNILLFTCLAVSILLLFGLNLITGSVQIPFADVLDILFGRFIGKESWQYIILENRFPQALTALLCGASLSVCGLMLQTAFRNPLAGPDVFGISSGAGLGVALVMLLLGGTVSTTMFTVSGFLAILTAAFLGAIAVTALILFLSTLVRNSILLLIVGIMVGYVSSSAVSLLNFFASDEGVKSYMIWGMGNFGGVSINHIPFFAILCLMGIMASFLLVKPLNILLLGPQYAESLGISTRKLRNILLVIVGLLTAITTAFCGPISFIGLAIPHIARLLFRTENHQTLLPGTVLCGAAIALLCNFICFLPGETGIIPLNAVTPLIGAPVIIYVVLQRR